MSIQPKDTGTILNEYKLILDRLYENIPRNAPDVDWLRSALTSHLLWAANELQNDMPEVASKDHWLNNIRAIAEKLI